MSKAERLERSKALHQEVLNYARSERWSHAEFRRLAAAISSFQADCQGRTARRPPWATGSPLPGLSPATSDVFRFRAPFNFEPEDAASVFQTSGTTTPHPGRHWMRTTATYRELAVKSGSRALLDVAGRNVCRSVRVLALMPAPRLQTCSPPDPTSSLAFMSAEFMRAFDGLGLERREWDSFAVNERGRWLLTENGVQLAELHRQIDLANAAAEPLLLLTTSFALVQLLDDLGNAALNLPAGSVLMTTGGFKGRSRELAASELYALAFERLGPNRIVGEYGMTELSSQLYERPSERSSQPEVQGLYFEPGWLRVYPLHPVTHRPVPDGDVGLACFVDLANVDSSVCVLTQDLVRREGGGVRLLGRAPGAIVRGCSLAVEELWKPAFSFKKATLPFAPAEPASVSREDGKGHERAAKARVRRLLDAARLIKDPNSDWGRRARLSWAQSSGLSPEGLALGVEHSLESDVSEEQLSEFCGAVTPSSRVWVNLPGNSPIAGLRAIALGLAASDQVCVRMSRRDRVLASLLHEATASSGAELFHLVTELKPEPGDHVAAYGSDEALQAIQCGLPPGVTFEVHGSGFGAVVLVPGDDLVAAAEGVALDMVLFDQQGCLSPRIAVVQAGTDEGQFVERLREQLEHLADRVPMGVVSRSFAGEQSWSRATFAHIADVVDAGSGFIAVQREPASWLLAPAARNLVVYCTAQPTELICQLGHQLTTVACSGLGLVKELREAAPQARFCQFGQMQRPAFDGPVDRRCR